jgi:predicted nucleotidyltransferase component of viral defense system
MIPKIHIMQWHDHAPWSTFEQVEQDLILSRMLCELYAESFVADNLIFRGGTALHKLYFPVAGRYSEDIDLVQIHAQPIGKLIDAIRSKLDVWMGAPKRKSNEGRFTLYYNFDPTSDIPTQGRIKIEINTREHFSVLGTLKKEFIVNNSWFGANAMVSTYQLEELIATKLRALYQRKKGRDLFDLWVTLQHHPQLNVQSVIECFGKYMAFENRKISKDEFEKNLLLKKQDPVFTADISALLAQGGSVPQQGQQVEQVERNNIHNHVARYNIPDAVDVVLHRLVAKM